jgi:hypothetical protein
MVEEAMEEESKGGFQAGESMTDDDL